MSLPQNGKDIYDLIVNFTTRNTKNLQRAQRAQRKLLELMQDKEHHER